MNLNSFIRVQFYSTFKLSIYCFLTVCMSLNVRSQSLPFTPPICASSECKFNQSFGTSNSVTVGSGSSIGVNSSASASAGYNSASSANLVLDTFGVNVGANVDRNTSIQKVGLDSENKNLNVDVTIKGNSLILKSRDGEKASNATAGGSTELGNNFSESTTNTNDANFSAAGFSAFQDLRILGGASTVKTDNGVTTATDYTSFKSSVTPYVEVSPDGNTKGTTDIYASANSSAGGESRTRISADTNSQTFINSFISAF